MTTLIELIPVLLNKTADRKIPWEDGGDRSFIAVFGDNIVKIKYDHQSQSVDYRLSLLNSEGSILESYAPDRQTDESETLEELWDAARRRAFLVDDRLDTLKKMLNDL